MILDKIHALYNRAETQRVALSNASWALSEALRHWQKQPSPPHAEAVMSAAQRLEHVLLTP